MEGVCSAEEEDAPEAFADCRLADPVREGKGLSRSAQLHHNNNNESISNVHPSFDCTAMTNFCYEIIEKRTACLVVLRERQKDRFN